MQQQMQQDMASLQGGGAPATPPTPPTAMNPPPGQYSQWGNNPAPVTPPTPVQGPDGANIGAGNGAGNFNNWNPGAVNQYGGQQIAGATPSQADYQSVQGYADAAHQNARRYLDPQQDMQNRRMSQELINQGIDPNSAQGQERMKMLGMQQADANNAAAFGAMQFGQGIQNQMSQQELANQQLAGQMQQGLWNQQGQASGRDLQWGLGQMQNDQFGRGLEMQKYGMDQNYALGQGGLANQKYGMNLSHELGMGNLDLNRGMADYNQMMGLADYDMRVRQYNDQNQLIQDLLYQQNSNIPIPGTSPVNPYPAANQQMGNTTDVNVGATSRN